jgi:NADPH:quinone reductase-like Zn-dependent oxidoreductase
MLLVNPLTALAFFDIAKRGKHAAIVSTAAASALGRMIVRLGARHGVPIINIVRRQSHVELLHSMGAKYVLNTGDADFSAQLQTLAHQLNATLLLDALAGRQTPQLLRAAPAGSTVVVYGYLAREPSVIEATTFLYEEKELTGFYLPNWLAKKGLFQVLRDTSRVQQLAGTDLQTTVQRRVPLSAAQEALELYQGNMTAGKVLLLANQSDVSNG